jgi:predicted tellurium resistance membrane protein TerC
VFNRLLPQPADNSYRGYRLALWIFALLVLMKVAMSLNSIFNGHAVASTADGIPLDTFTPAGAQAVVALFAIWGLGHLMICVLCITVLVRYRALVPFMFALLLLEHLGRKLILQVMPIARTGAPPGSIVNLILLAVMVAGLALSLGSVSRRSGP